MPPHALCVRARVCASVRQAQTPDGLKALGWLLDVAIECAKRGVCDPAAPFTLLEEAMEATPIAHCEAVWGVLESRRDQLTLVSHRLQLRQQPLPRLVWLAGARRPADP